jgi:kumamolisin
MNRRLILPNTRTLQPQPQSPPQPQQHQSSEQIPIWSPPPPPVLSTYLKPNYTLSTEGRHFFASNYAKIYNFPKPPTTPIVIGVISLGGSLYGNYNTNTRILKDGDVQKYWQLCNIMPAQQPTVLIVPISGIYPSAYKSGTDENTLDVATIGACCPGSNVTIVLYVAPNTYNGMVYAFNAAINGTTVNGTFIKSNIISCSWGAPENVFPSSTIDSLESLFQHANEAGIPICVASSASDGESEKIVEYPSSSPHVIACGGTTLQCPNLTYDSDTSESAWSSTTTDGGNYSALFTMPDWQTALKASHPVLQKSDMRAVPDIAMNADPATGVHMLIGNKVSVVGGTGIVAAAMAALIGCMNIPSFSAAKLYSAMGTFQDKKENNGGFNIVKEYDCVTGLGSPNGVALAVATQ